MIFFDTSALAKRYVLEVGSNRINTIITKGDFIAVSKLAYPEMLSALARKRKNSELTIDKYADCLKQFELDWHSFLIIDFLDELLPVAKKLIAEYHLRGADSIHLASALWIKWSTNTEVNFVASDNALLTAAKNEKLITINPAD